jgi:hypothetical protein
LIRFIPAFDPNLVDIELSIISKENLPFIQVIISESMDNSSTNFLERTVSRIDDNVEHSFAKKKTKVQLKPSKYCFIIIKNMNFKLLSESTVSVRNYRKNSF